MRGKSGYALLAAGAGMLAYGALATAQNMPFDDQAIHEDLPFALLLLAMGVLVSGWAIARLLRNKSK